MISFGWYLFIFFLLPIYVKMMMRCELLMAIRGDYCRKKHTLVKKKWASSSRDGDCISGVSHPSPLEVPIFLNVSAAEYMQPLIAFKLKQKRNVYNKSSYSFVSGHYIHACHFSQRKRESHLYQNKNLTIKYTIKELHFYLDLIRPLYNTIIMIWWGSDSFFSKRKNTL